MIKPFAHLLIFFIHLLTLYAFILVLFFVREGKTGAGDTIMHKNDQMGILSKSET